MLGRRISDNIIILLEVLQTVRRRQGQQGYMAVKIDLEKAYDSVHWPFLCETLLEARLNSIAYRSHNELCFIGFH